MIREFIKMKRLKKIIRNIVAPDYEILVADNAELRRKNIEQRQDIYNLIRHPNERAGLFARSNWELSFMAEDAMMFGCGSTINRGISGFAKEIY